MAVDIDTIGIGADTREIKAATKDLDNFGRSADKASRQADNFGTAAEKGASTASIGISRFASAAAGAFSAYAAFTKYVQSADTYTKITAQIKLTTSTQEQFNTALADVKRIASTAQTELEAVSKLYTRLSGSLNELGVEQRKIADISETVALALRVSGATAGETASVMLQLSQAFGSGVLRGDEFNSMAENSPILLRALASSMGVTTGALRDMASEGKITRDVLLKAYGDPKLLEMLRTQAKEINTIGGAWQFLKNQITLSVGELDKATKASNLFIESLKAVGSFVGEGNPFQIIGSAANATNNRFQQLLGIRSPSSRASDRTNGNAVPGMAAVYGGASYPNYSATIAVQDVEKIHKAQEELRTKAAEQAKKVQEAETTRRMGALQLYWENEGRRFEQFANKKADQYEAQEKAEKEEFERRKKQMELLQKQANANFDEAQRNAREFEEQLTKSTNDVGRSLTDALLRGFERGESFAQNFINRLKDMFKTLVLEPVINFILNTSGISRFVASIGGIFSSGSAIAGQSAGGGLSSIFGSITDVFKSGNASIVSSIQSLGTFLSDGPFKSLGGLIGQYSSQIADGFGYFGAALQLAQGNVGGALGAGIGTFFGGPLGGAIGSFLGGALGGLFGGGLPPRVTESRVGSFSNGVFSASEGADPGRRKLGAASQLDQLNQTFANNLYTLFNAFDLETNITSKALLTKKKNTRSVFEANVNGQQLSTYFGTFGKKGTFEQAFQALVENALGQMTVQAIQASSLPEGIKQFFDGLVNKEQVAETINTLIGMKKALIDLPPIFNAVRNAMDTTAYTTSLEQLKAQFQATQTFVDLFYSDTEKFDIFSKQLLTQFNALNQAIPTSRDQYRALVESINVVDEATRDQFNGLIALAPAMNQYFEYLEQQVDGINQVNDALAQALDRNLFSTYADYVTAQANASAGLTYTGSIGDLSVRRAQGDAELVNAVKALQVQQASTTELLREIAWATKKTADVNQTWNGDGLPETRVY